MSSRREKRLLKKEPKKPTLNIREIYPLTENQHIAFDAYAGGKNLMLHGIAGTGKSLISLYLGLDELLNVNADHDIIVIIRSVVPTRDMGFLPGNVKEKAKAYGLDFSGFSTQASFFDYDQDGDMDMYLLNHSVHSTYSYGNIKLRTKPNALAGDVLYENTLEKGEIKFIDVTKKAGIYNSALGYGLAIATSDINNDGLIDIYIGNDFHENDYLYLNNQDGTFTESIGSMITNSLAFLHI